MGRDMEDHSAVDQPADHYQEAGNINSEGQFISFRARLGDGSE
jgi:hypothetical protein